MAQLGEQNRQRIANGLMRYWSKGNIDMDFSSAELLADVIATDAWIDDNQASYLAALTAGLANEQKVLLFLAVTSMRTDPAWLRLMVGEVD